MVQQGKQVLQRFKELRCDLFHEKVEKRATSLRSMRHLLKDEQSVIALLSLNLPMFIVRSIDIVLENRLERIQALRLIRKFLSISPKLFPPAFTRSLIAVAQDGLTEHDTLTRACWALLAELSILSPKSSTKDTQNCAFNAIMDAAISGNQPHSMCESLISTLLFMLNWPRYRSLIRTDILQIFVAPFTDPHYTAPISKNQQNRANKAAKFEYSESYDQRKNRFTAAKVTLISILRSWQGLIYLCEPQSSEHNLVSNSCLKSLINMLYLPYDDVRRRIIDLIFDLLYLPLPESTIDFESGIKSIEKLQISKDSWKIHDAFIVDEAKSLLLPNRSRTRMNLVNNYVALLLLALFHCNVVDALSAIIICPSSQEISMRATILLYELLLLSSKYLPTDSFSQYLTLSVLIKHATSKKDDSRDLANAALTNLGRVHPIKKTSNTSLRCSLFLNQILEFCAPHQNCTATPTKSNTLNPNTLISNNFLKTNGHSNQSTPTSRSPSTSSISSLSNVSLSSGKLYLKRILKLGVNSTLSHSLQDSQHWEEWDWDLISYSISRPSDSLRKLSSHPYRSFIQKLVHFFKPSSNQYSMIDINDKRSRHLCETGFNLINFLCENSEPRATEYLKDLINDVAISMQSPEKQPNTNFTNQCTPIQQATASNDKVLAFTQATTITLTTPNSSNMISYQTPAPNYGLLSGSRSINTMSCTYFLFIGKLSSTLKGYRLLEQSNIIKIMDELTQQATSLSASQTEAYVRLIITGLDYTKEYNNSRELLTKFMFSHPEDSVKIFATNFLRVLLRANLHNFDKWAMKLLVKQLESKNRVLHTIAASVLDEACDLDKNLDALIAMGKYAIDILRDSGDAGILLLCRIGSRPDGLRMLIESPVPTIDCPLDSVLNEKAALKVRSNDNNNKDESSASSSNAEYPSLSSMSISCELDTELTRWKRVFNYRYVKLVEDSLNNSLTYHQKGEDGKYGRRVDKVNPTANESYFPPHLYSQFAETEDGIQILESRKILESEINLLLHQPDNLETSEESLLRVKAAIWIVGHVGSRAYGYKLLIKLQANIVELIVDIARDAQVLSLRGTAFYVLGLLGSTQEGADELKNHNWIAQCDSLISLPLRMDLIFAKPRDACDNCSDDDDDSGAAVIGFGDTNDAGAKFETPSNELHVKNDVEIDDNTSTQVSKEEDDDDNDNDNKALMSSFFPGLPAPVSPELLAAYSIAQIDQIRKDILKYVADLNLSTQQQSIEANLLNIKSKFLLVFHHDLALYTEVCHQMATYNFRLAARRFLQELFLEVKIK